MATKMEKLIGDDIRSIALKDAAVSLLDHFFTWH